MATKKPTTETGAALALNVESAPDLLQLLGEELKKLTAISETSYLTSGNLEVFGDIKKETNIPKLIMAMSMVEGKEKAYQSAAEGSLAPSLGGTYEVFSISGGTAKNWAHDINLRISVIKYSTRKAELEALLEKGKSFLTQKDQFNMFLKEVAATVKQ